VLDRLVLKNHNELKKEPARQAGVQSTMQAWPVDLNESVIVVLAFCNRRYISGPVQFPIHEYVSFESGRYWQKSQ
jgi:hypothetical protein